MTLLVATTNRNKLKEIRPIVADRHLTLLTLDDLAPIPEPDETGASFWENARLKALAYAQASGYLTVAEDSGLEIEALDGEPGIRSARFLGPDTSYPDRFAEIFRRLAATPDARRDARFVTALALARGDRILFETEARIDGVIASAPAGTNGFGYDPIFFHAAFGKTTAELSLDDKTAVSHRARAFRDLRRALFTLR
jgi:XTP/dITP diphosphohydrolase